MSKRVYLETFGCQMNVLDSELVMGQLCTLGYEPVRDYRSADLVLINTCSVREHAEEKAYSRLGEVGHIKRRRPEMVVGVIGCMAERDTEGIRSRTPFVDLVCGPGNLNEIPGMLAEIDANRGLDANRGDEPSEDAVTETLSSLPVIALEQDHSRRTPKAERTLLHDNIESLDLSRAPTGDGPQLQSYVRVQRGCDKFCTFCVVPFTRGPERSRPPGHIVEEARRLIGMGTKEITLLGQTVNSYKYAEGDRSTSFAELLEQVHEIDGLERLRFVTSYPGDFGDDVLQAMRDLPRLCEYLHLPAQSGSNDVLKRMKRQYTVEEYLDLVDRARTIVPGITLASDFIVGFCGETEADHEATLSLVERVAYKNIFMFKYSERPRTAADRRLPDDVPDDTKGRRLTDLAQLQKRLSMQHHQALVGKTVEVLVEGYSKAAIQAQEAEQARGQEVDHDRSGSEQARARTKRYAKRGEGTIAPWKRADQLTGRTRGDEIAVFTGPASLIGQTIRLTVNAATALTLHGELVADSPNLHSLSVTS